MLKEKITNKSSGIITYGITPPKETSTTDKMIEISTKQYERLKDLDIDGLLLYDVQEEADRLDEARPFPYSPMMEPSRYSNEFLKQWDIPKVIYRCVGKYSKDQLSDWIRSGTELERYSVFVGSSSSKQQVQVGLPDAYDLSRNLNPNLMLGGVMIPERHAKYGNEHERVVKKMKEGCHFFVSQATYNLESSKDFLSDYFYYCRENEIETVPILFNFTPCGSQKTLEFMKWLGISIPKWLENDLKHSTDILDKSIRQSLKIFEELLDFGIEKGIPIGCSVESVSTRKVEIEASVELVKDIKALIDKKLG